MMEYSEVLLVFFFLQLILITVSAQLCGVLAERLGQTKVIGEIIAGLILGPSLFGLVSPDAYNLVFKSVPPQSLYFMGQIGLALLMFQIGLEFDFSHLRAKKNKRTSIAIALSSFGFPLVLGIIAAWYSRPYLAPNSEALGYVLFCGTALCITAVPVLGRIVMDLGVARLPVSGIAMMAAAITDILGWFLLAIVVAIVSAKFQLLVFLTQIALFLGYVVVCWFVVRPLLLKIIVVLDAQQHHVAVPVIGILFAAILLSGLATSLLGLHSAFGGFMMGLLVRGHHGFAARWKTGVAGFINASFVPVFFAYAGSHAELGQIASWNLLPWFGLFLTVAILGKFVGSYVVARLTGLNSTQAKIVGALMNTRGLMELIVLTVGLDLGIIPVGVYTVLVLMALATTLMTGPLLRRWIPHVAEQETDKHATCAVQRVKQGSGRSAPDGEVKESPESWVVRQ